MFEYDIFPLSMQFMRRAPKDHVGGVAVSRIRYLRQGGLEAFPIPISRFGDAKYSSPAELPVPERDLRTATDCRDFSGAPHEARSGDGRQAGRTAVFQMVPLASSDEA